MDDVVAVELRARSERHYFLTWGRIFDPPDDEHGLLAAVTDFAPARVRDATDMSRRVCETLGEAAHAPYFFEGLLHFARQPIPYGDGYDSWRKERRKQMEEGREIYYCRGVL